MKKQLILTLIVSAFLQACSKQAEPPAAVVVEKPAAQVSDAVTLTENARQRLELQTATVQSRNAVESLSTTGEIKEDEGRVFHINSLTTGRVVRENVGLGSTITAGQTLAFIQNLEIVKIYTDFVHQFHQNKVDMDLAQTKLELSKKNHARIKILFEEHIAPEKDVIKAASDLKVEEQTLAGLKEHAIHLREEASAMLNAYGVKLPSTVDGRVQTASPIIAPRGGVITKKNVTVGDVVSNTEPLYIVADLSKVWLDLAVYDKQLLSIRAGSVATFSSDSLPGKSFSGRVTYIKPSTEEGSGTFVARVELTNPHLTLKPGMLGEVHIENRSGNSLPFVPEQALQKYGNETFVFVDQGNGSYKKRLISLGDRAADGYLVSSGLSAGDRIVTKGSFALKAQMLKSSLEDE